MRSQRIEGSAQRLGRRGLQRLRSQLTERDLDILGSVDEYRLLTARHIETLHFTDHASPLTAARSARRVLGRLVRDRLLVRLERRIGGVRAGSASFIYAVGPIGHRLLHDDSSRRWREPSEVFVAHALEVADLMMELTERHRAREIEIAGHQTEPDCWRNFPRPMAGTQTLKPDLLLITVTEDSELRWFVEVDLGTESGAAIVRKCRTYQAYWQSGAEQEQHGVFPKVLWITVTPRRTDFLRKTIAKARSLHQPLFQVTTTVEAIPVLTGAAT